MNTRSRAFRAGYEAKRILRTYLPNRSPVEWAMTMPEARGKVMHVGRPVQIIGGKRWGISFLRMGEFGYAEDFWEAKE